MKLIKSLFLPLLLVTMFTNNAKGQFTSKCKLTYTTTTECGTYYPLFDLTYHEHTHQAYYAMHVSTGDYSYVVYFGPDSDPQDYLYEIVDNAYDEEWKCQKYLATITFPTQFKRLGAYSFRNFVNLTSFTLTGTQVTEILEHTFNGCTSLKTVNLPIANNVNTINSIGDYAFYNCAKLTSSYTFGKNFTRVGDYAFYNCANFTSITFPDNIDVEIGQHAFENTGITSFTTKGITYIPNYAFCNSKIKTLTLSSALVDVGSYAFQNNKMTTLTIPGNVKYVGDYAFCDCSNLTSLTIKDGVESIGGNAFSSDNFKKVVIPNSVKSIGNGAFQNTPLESVTLPNSIKSISNLLFQNCKLTNITIPNTVNTIGSNAFENCPLTSIEIPSSVTSIGSYAFRGCTKLKTVKCYCTTPPTLGTSYYFYNIYIDAATFSDLPSDAVLWVPYGCKEAYQKAEGWNKFGTIKEMYYDNEIRYASTDNEVVVPYITSAFGSTYQTNSYQDGTGLIKFSGSVAKVGNQAFYNKTNLKWIDLNSTVASIGEKAFYGCTSLEQVKSTSTLKSISSYAFYGCNSLKSIAFPDGQTTINSYTFYNCSNLPEFKFSDNVTKIDSYAFYGCESLENLTFPSTITSIGESALRDCSGLKSITVASETPASCGANSFEGIDKDIPVYVPRGCVSTYQKATGWSYFTNITENIVKEKERALKSLASIVKGVTEQIILSQYENYKTQIENARTLDGLNEIKVKAEEGLKRGIECYKAAYQDGYSVAYKAGHSAGVDEGKVQASKSLPTQGTSGNGVRIILQQENEDDKVLELFNPSKVQFFRKD